MYRISVTMLEKFRRFTKGVSSFDTEEALIECIKGIFLGNDKTKTGGAFHKIIEGEFHLEKESELVLADNFLFTVQQAAPALAYRAAHPTMVHEIPVTKSYQLREYLVVVSGRLDGWEGIQIRDPKTKFRKPDFQEYLDSYQWRFYLEMTGLNVFYYDVFEVKGFKELGTALPYHLPKMEILEAEELMCIRYPELFADCMILLEDFMEYIKTRDFFHLLKKIDEPVIC